MSVSPAITMRCFVPNCENTIGVPFPEDYELQNIWLKGLQITDGLPDSSSFVCLDHFDKNDIEEIVNEGESLEKRVRDGAVPRVFALEDVIEKETEEFLEFRNQKIAISENPSELPDISEPVEQQELIQATEEACLNPPVVEEVQQPSEFAPQFQEFQENDFILEQQEYSESQSSSQSFPTYSQDADTVHTQEQDVSQESTLVIQDNQAFLATQHEFGPQQVFTTEAQDFTSQSQSVQIYNSQEDQSIFNTEDQQEFVSERPPLLTPEGHEVFESEEEQHNTTTESRSFSEVDDYSQNGSTQSIKEEHMQGDHVQIAQEEHMQEDHVQIAQEEHMQVIQGDHVQIAQEDHMQVVQEDLENDQLGEHQVLDDPQNQTEQGGEVQGETPTEEENVQEATSEDLVVTKFSVKHEEIEPEPMIVDQETVTQNYSEIPQQSSDAVIEKQETESTTTPENILMQWFVPNQSNNQTESVDPIAPSNTLEDQSRIVISYQQDSDIHPKVIQQHIILEKNQQPSPTKIIKNEKVVQAEKPKEDCCRLCMSNEQVSVNILDNIKDNIMVLEAIQLCLHPLEVSLEDPFSKTICVKCFNLLQKYFQFRQFCLKVDSDQKRTYEKAHPQHRFLEKRKLPQLYGNYPKKTHMKTIISPSSKVGYRQTEIVTVVGSTPKGQVPKNVSRKVILTPTTKKKTQSDEIQYLLKDVNINGPNEKCVQKIISKVSRADDIQVFKLKKSLSPNQNGQSYTPKYQTVQKTLPIPISSSPKKFDASQIEALVRKPPLSTAKQMKIQEELKKVIEGTMSKDDLSVDHVIVRVVSDDEADENEHADYFPAKRKKYDVPITRPVISMQPKQEFSKMKIGRSEVVIPKGIRVSIPEKFESGKGIYPCFPKIGAFGTEFALIDGYLFEYRLCKGKERFLRCVSAACPSLASQKLLANGKFENRASVKSSHNHLQLTSTEIKKHMFYYVMKKKMQADKGLNFRSVYDQICEKDPEIKTLVPLRSLINEICKHQLTQKMPQIKTFDDFYNMIEDDSLQKFQFTYSGKQFYQERFTVKEEGTKAVIFANAETIKKVSHSKLMYVDASFRIDTGENFSYQLVTVLVWIDDSYYPIMFALVSNRTMEIFKKIFAYLHDSLAPNLRPEEIVTDYEANLYYALGETYLESHIGGSVFYYTQNLYKKICELGLSKELEATPYFRNVYHMLLMLPLLPVNTIMDGLQNIEIQAIDLGVGDRTAGLFEHIKEQWMEKVTPDLFCVHRLENRINENVIAPFKKLRDFLMLSKGKTQRQTLYIMNVVEKLIDLENFLQTTYSSENKKSFGRDLSSSQKKNVLKAWQYIETHPKININHFFSKVIGYIKCMENQLWIWGYYKFSGKVTDDLINAANFSIVNTNETETEEGEDGEPDDSNFLYTEESENTVVVEAVVGPSGEFVLSNPESSGEVDNNIFKYVYK